MKKALTALCMVILFSGMWLGIYAETPECDHQWMDYDKELHGVAEGEITLAEVNDFQHAYQFTPPEKVCALCDERLQTFTGGGAGYHSHSYTVTFWVLSEPSDVMSITLSCGVCQHAYQAQIPLQTILDGTADTCLFGGECDTKARGYLYENGMILENASIVSLPYGFTPGEQIWNEAIVYNSADQTFTCVCRAFCPRCGRPENMAESIIPPAADFDPRYNGLPIMTMEYFLTNGVPENLPYQLIDQLRAKYAAAN